MNIKKLTLCFLPLVCSSMLLVANVADTQDGERDRIGIRSLPESEMVAIEKSRDLLAQEHDKQVQIDALMTAPTEFISLACGIAKSEFSVANIVPDVKATKNDTVLSFTNHPGIFHNAVGFSGNKVGLEDGSWWTIYSGDFSATRNWLTTANSLQPDSIVIVPNNDWPHYSSYRYFLTNQQTNVSVRANLTLAPLKHGIYTRHIYSTIWLIDNSGYFYVQLCLNDGSVWNMLPSDFAITSLWHAHDTVIIGANGSSSAAFAPNILINILTDNNAAGTCVKY